MDPEPPSDREEAFRDLLMNMSQRLNGDDTDKLAFMTEYSGPKNTPLELLATLRKKGILCPFTGSRLEKLLRSIHRHDLADGVEKYVERFPDRHRSMQERRSAPVITLKKRSATDPPSHVQSVPYSQGDTSERPVVQQEEGMKTRDYPVESLPPSPSMYQAPVHYEHRPQQAFTYEQGLPHMNIALQRSTSQEPFCCYSTDASSESSLHSLSSRQPRITHATVQMSVEFIPEQSQEALSDQWYRSSQSSMASSLSGRLAHHSDSATGYASFPSDTESRPSQVRCKKNSRSCYGPAPKDSSYHSISNIQERPFQYRSSSLRSCADERRCSVPQRRRHHTNPEQQHPLDTAVQGLTMEDLEYEDGDNNAKPQGEVVRRERNPTSVRCVKLIQGAQPQSSDHTPPATDDSVATLQPKLRSVSELEQSRTPRASVYSETTSEGTTVSPTTSFCGKESIHDSDDRVSSAQQSPPQPTKTFQKEKPLWKKLVSSMEGSHESGKYEQEKETKQNSVAHTLVDAHHRPHNRSQRLFQRLSRSKKSEPQTLTWTILREKASEIVWKHEEQGCMRCPQQLQVDAGCGDSNPHLMFRLHPYGLFEDKGKNMTLFVKTIIPDDCPPIHPYTKLYLTVRVCVVDGKERKQLHVHQLEPKVNSCVRYLFKFMSHKQLQKINCKELDIEISASTG